MPIKLLIAATLLFLSYSHSSIACTLHDAENSTVDVLIEIPAGTSEKWEVAKSTGELELERLANNKPRIIQYLPYPFNYGMVPKSILSKENGGDGDPLDAVVIGDAIKRGSTITGKVIGIAKMTDKGEQDDKIIVIAKNSPLHHIQDIDQLDKEFPGVTNIIKTWLTNYKGQGKITIEGFSGKKQANDVISKALQEYKLKR